MNKWMKIILFSLVLALVVGGSSVYFIYARTKADVQADIHRPVPSIETSVTEKKLENIEPLNVLLLGIDKRKGDKGRSDTIMVANINPETEKITLISIPRDTRVQIVDEHGNKKNSDKINHAYAFGGVDGAVRTVENFLHTEMDYYVKLDMEGLMTLVNQFGGLTLTNEQNFSYNGHNFPSGQITLNGEQTLAYIQMRKQDPAGDLGRNERQRMVVEEFINKGKSLRTVSKFPELLNAIKDSTETNVNVDSLGTLVRKYRHTSENIEMQQLSGTGTTIDGIYYMLASNNQVESIQSLLVTEK